MIPAQKSSPSNQFLQREWEGVGEQNRERRRRRVMKRKELNIEVREAKLQ